MTRAEAISATHLRRNAHLPGLAQMYAAAKPGECPFCGEAIPPRKGAHGRHPTHCQDPVCWRAWFRCNARKRPAVMP